MSGPPLRALFVASLVVLAGCAGGLSDAPGSPIGNTDDPGSTTATDDANQTDVSSTAAATDGGAVAFYISDERNAIGAFRHLNVTVTRVGFERANADGGGWIEREVDDATVDLTELQGANATLVNEYDLPTGSYGKVFAHVGEVNATLRTGERVRVKLPSEKLQLTNGFTVDNGSTVNFVFDIAVHEAGKSGKYILKPVVGESGTDVPIEPVDEEGEPEGLNATLLGNVSPGGDATVEVTRDGEAVANATVAVDGEPAGTTDGDGTLAFEVPDAETLTVSVEVGGEEVELEREFESGDGR